jgi:hypothetical protein
LLDLRFDAPYSIITAAEYGKDNLTALITRGLIAADASDDEKAHAIYLAHHEGRDGAISWLSGGIGEDEARQKLIGQIGAARAQQARDGSQTWATAYMSWIRSLVRPERFSGEATFDQTLTSPAPGSGMIDQVLQDRVIRIAAGSEIARFHWRDRGVAPAGYIKGMALVFVHVYTKLNAGDRAATEMAKVQSGDEDSDALTWYDEIFAEAGMNNESAGADTLRHLFVLLIGLGMRESSGKYCVGRDQSASNTTAETAEAGLFQTSFDARPANSLLPQIFEQYSQNPVGFLAVFKEGVDNSNSDLENFGSGEGEEFQRLSKACPAFAAEFAAVGLRHIRKHWGPINKSEAEIRPECDAMLRQVQAAVDGAPEV